MTLVVDASVASKWVLPEPDSESAVALRRSEPHLIAPSLVVAEIGNALWKAHLRGNVTAEDTLDMLRIAAGHFHLLVATETLAIAAIEFATYLRHPIYDCLYLALAERENVPLITADARLLAAAKKAKVKVRPL